MTTAVWFITVLVLLSAAAVLAWPRTRGLNRLRGREAESSVKLAAVRIRLSNLAERNPGRLMAMTLGAVATAGLLVGGPVAATVLVMYSALALRALVRRTRSRRVAASRAAILDDLCGLAADLRAGLPPATSARTRQQAAMIDRKGAKADRPDATKRITDLTAAVWRLAERTGAPAADLVERIEADARTADRARASAAAEAAGAQVTAILLAALPLGGIGLGYSMGADPLDVLLHSPIGAGCAIGAVVLQGAGLLWSERLMSGAAR